MCQCHFSSYSNTCMTLINIFKILNQYVAILQIKLHIIYYNGVYWHLSDFALRFAHVLWHLYCRTSFHCLNAIHTGICVLLSKKDPYCICNSWILWGSACCRDRDSSSSLSMQHYFESPRRHISEHVCGTDSRDNSLRREEPFWMWMVPSHGLGFKAEKKKQEEADQGCFLTARSETAAWAPALAPSHNGWDT